jgi:hypothetical protein
MDTLYAIIIFILMLIIYSQVMFQLKKGDDMEVYEIDYTNNDDLNKSANLKQPIIFQFSNFANTLQDYSLKFLAAEYGSFDVFIKETEDYHDDRPVNSAVIELNAAESLVKTDASNKYFSNQNQSFIYETGLDKYYKQLDKYLKPTFSVFSKYDVVFGSVGTTTPLTYHTYERRFIYVNGGKIQVKMTPWRSNKYMVVNKDYANYEFTSPLNVWNPQDTYRNGFQKMKFLDFNVHSGNMLYIPPFWYYSIKIESDDGLIYCADYGSPMNILSNVVNLGHYFYETMIPKREKKKVIDADAVADADAEDLAI